MSQPERLGHVALLPGDGLQAEEVPLGAGEPPDHVGGQLHERLDFLVFERGWGNVMRSRFVTTHGGRWQKNLQQLFPVLSLDSGSYRF